MPQTIQPNATSRRKPGRPKNPHLESRILHAAQSLMTTRGLDAVSMDDVAIEAGTCKTTIYLRFDGKQELLDAALGDLLSRLPAATHLTQVDARDPLEVQLLLVAHRVNDLLSSPGFELLRQAISSNISKSMRERLRETASTQYLRAINDHLVDQADRGLLDLRACRSPAATFIALVTGGEGLLLWPEPGINLMNESDVRHAVRVFMALHRTLTPEPHAA